MSAETTTNAPASLIATAIGIVRPVASSVHTHVVGSHVFTVPPTMPGREAFRETVFVAQMATGYAFPNALLQHALPDLQPLIIDLPAMERRRDRLVGALREIGYETTMPEGTFYIMARSPMTDDVAFTDILARHRVLVLPGTIVEVPGWFRISLTATDEMVERGIPPIGVDIYTPDFLTIARGFGCRAGRAENLAHLQEQLQQAARAAGPTLIEIDEERALYWLRVGAQPSSQVRNLMSKLGIWETFVKERPSALVGVKTKVERPAKEKVSKKAQAKAAESKKAAAAPKAPVEETAAESEATTIEAETEAVVEATPEAVEATPEA